MKIALLLLITASAALAGEVTYPVPRKQPLVVAIPFNKIEPLNVGVKVEEKKLTPDKEGRAPLTFNVKTSGNKFDGAVIELCFLYDNGYHEARWLSGGQAKVAVGSDEFDFKLNPYRVKDIAGWIVRVVNNGAIVGVAGSDHKFEELAASPSVNVLYGQK